MTQLTETKKLLVKILETPYNQEIKVPVKLGFGGTVVQRCRVELSRVRNKIRKMPGAKMPVFKLRADIESKMDKENPARSFDLITFKRVRDTDVVIDMSDIDKVLNDIVKKEIEQEEKFEREQKGNIIIKKKAQ